MPQLFCMLPDKQLATYQRLFQLLQQQAAVLNDRLQPAVIHIDFEQAVIAAVRAEFGIEPTGCLFHFSQNIFRHLQTVGLQMEYNTNNPPELRRFVRRLLALPLVPPIRIDQAFRATVDNAPDLEGCVEMITYVRNTYVDNAYALYGREIWNCFGSPERTTNACEGYHTVLNKSFQGRHPDIFTLLRSSKTKRQKRNAEYSSWNWVHHQKNGRLSTFWLMKP